VARSTTDKALFFGHPEAEKDGDLPSYFIPTHYAALVTEPASSYVIISGRKGCGKTALFRQYVPSPNVVVTRINPDSHTLPEPKAKLSASKLRRLFVLELLLESLRVFAAESASKPTLKPLVLEAEQLTQGYAGRLGRVVHAVKDTAKRLAKGTIEEGVPTFFGVTLKMKDADERDQLLELTASSHTKEMRQLIRKIGEKGFSFLALIDDPDELCWDTNELMPVLGGLCAAAVDVSSVSEIRDFFKVCVLVKQHHFDQLRRSLENFDHIASNVLSLSWEKPELESLIGQRVIHRLRLPTGTNMKDAWMSAFDPGTASLEVLQEYLNDRLTNGPRDLVVFCNKAMMCAQHRAATRIEMRDILAAEKEHSEDRLDEIEREFGDQYPSISAIVRRLFEHRDLKVAAKITRKKLEYALEHQALVDRMEVMRKEVPWFRDAVPAKLVRILFQVGVVGYFSPETAQKRIMNWSSISPVEGIDEAEDFFVPPAYHWALRIGAQPRQKLKEK